MRAPEAKSDVSAFGPRQRTTADSVGRASPAPGLGRQTAAAQITWDPAPQ